MSNELSFFDRLKAHLPQSRPGMVLLVGVVVVAFSFGLMVTGNNDDSTSVATDTQQAHASDSASEPTVWTCAMHPQIKLPKPGKCPICFMDLIPLQSSSGDDLGPRQLRMSEAAKGLAQIETTPVRRAVADAQIRMVGRVTYDETRLSYITAWVPGRLDSLYAAFTGTTVTRGDPMVYMYSPQLLAAQEELIQASKAIKSLNNSNTVLKSTASATLKAARDKLKLYGLTEKQIEAIEASSTAGDHVTITAPVSGTVVVKDAKEGMYVKTGTQIYTIADLSKLWVLFDAYESDLPWLREGQTVNFTARSLPGENFSAKITFIDPILDQSTRTVKVRAVVDNRQGRLKPDMFISGAVKSRLSNQGSVVAASRSGVDNPLMIPASAPLITGKRAVVYIELPNDDGPLFEGREIVLGPRAGDFYIVKSGLAEGDQVVTNGAFKIDAELQIHAKPSMMFVEGGDNSGHDHGNGEIIPAVATTKDVPNEHDMQMSDSRTSMAAVREALAPVYSSYFNVQRSLASDDPETALASYKALADALQSVDMGVFGESHGQFMSIYGDMLKQARAGAQTADIKGAREVFLQISKAAIQLEKDFGHSGDQYYLTFCPMADNNKGAYWLQTVDTVYNSFYGAAMLRCGSIKEALPARKAERD